MRRTGNWVAVGLLFGLLTSQAFGSGAYFSAAGPVNRGMGGASTAAPIDSIGALYWNPATISGMAHDELAIGLDLVLINHRISSSVGAFAGSTASAPGIVPVPTVGWVHHVQDSPITIGMGVGGVAGLKTNLAVDPTNPVLAPPPGGFGQVSAEGSFVQLTPVISYALSETTSVAVGPVLTLGQVLLQPFVFEAPNAGGLYPSARTSGYHWGGGAQAGIYHTDQCWHYGASIKSPAWMEEFGFTSVDAAGGPRTLRANIDLPLIVSLGMAYSGCEDWVFALDLRYFDWANADGFGDRAQFDGTGALGGLDWSSVYSVSMGAQRQLNDQLFVRLGYSYNESPIKNSEAGFNMATPLHYEHTVGAGLSYMFCNSVGINIGYSYMLPSDRTGPIHTPLGPIPGSTVTSELDAHFFNIGVMMRH